MSLLYIIVIYILKLHILKVLPVIVPLKLLQYKIDPDTIFQFLQ